MRTYVLDASALIAFLEDKAGAQKIEAMLIEARRAHARIFMSSLNYGEVYSKLLRDQSQEQARRTISGVSPLPIEIQDVTAQRSFRAAEIKNTYKLYYADAFAAGLAIEHKATLVTGDSDFKKLGHGFPVLWLRSN